MPLSSGGRGARGEGVPGTCQDTSEHSYVLHNLSGWHYGTALWGVVRPWRGGAATPVPLLSMRQKPTQLWGAPREWCGEDPLSMRQKPPHHSVVAPPPRECMRGSPLMNPQHTQSLGDPQRRGLESPLSMRGRPPHHFMVKEEWGGGGVSTSNPVVPPGGRHTPCLPLTPHTTCTYSLHHPHIPHFSPYYPLAFSPHPAYTFLSS